MRRREAFAPVQLHQRLNSEILGDLYSPELYRSAGINRQHDQVADSLRRQHIGHRDFMLHLISFN